MTAISIIIPVYNEAQILASSITGLYRELINAGIKTFEIIISENGSSDNTRKLARNLAKRFSKVKVTTSDQPHFGEAFKQGVTTAHFSVIVLFNADWWDVKFLKKGLHKLNDYPIVVGSKRILGSSDNRPFLRKVGSTLLTYVLKIFFQFSGTDSHGMKVFRKRELNNLLVACVTDEIIESELLLRAQRRHLAIAELPVAITELRPARVGFLLRCFKVAKEIFYLRLVI